MEARILALALLAAGGLLAVVKWRQALRFVLVLLVLEGAIRKWVLPGAQEAIYFAKDGLLLAIYAGYLNDRAARRLSVATPPILNLALALGALVGMLQIFNPDLPNLWVGMFGWKAYFLYVPLVWVVPAAFESREELWRFLYLYCLLAIPLGALAMLQFVSPASSAINTYARSGGAPALSFGSSSYVRVTSTFSFISGFTSYLFAKVLLLLGLLTTIRWKFKGYSLLYAALGLTLVGMLATGSRGPVYMLLLATPLYWWLAAAHDRGSSVMVARAVIIVALLGVLVGSTASQVVGAFYGRATTTSDAAGRVLSPFVQPFLAFEDAGLLGIGIGATHQAATALVDDVSPQSWLQGMTFEDESGRVMLELGLFGFLLVYFARIYLIVYALQQARQISDRFCRAVAVSCMLFFLLTLPGGIVFNVTAGVFYWVFCGLLFLAIRLEREVVRSRSSSAAMAPRPLAAMPAAATGSSWPVRS